MAKKRWDKNRRRLSVGSVLKEVNRITQERHCPDERPTREPTSMFPTDMDLMRAGRVYRESDGFGEFIGNLNDSWREFHGANNGH